jgi:two-component system sensor histidine kinase PilS (NtrC family)
VRSDVPQNTSLINGERREQYISKLQWLLFLRLVISPFLLGTTLLDYFSLQLAYLNAFNALIGFNVLITLLSFFFVNRVNQLKIFGYCQIIWDIIFITLLVIISNDYEGDIFTFLYFVAIINSCILLQRQGAFIALFLILGLFAISLLYPLLASDRTSIIHLGDVIFRFVIYAFAFFSVAIAGNFLSEKLRKTEKELEAKESDILKLERLNDNIIRSVNMGLLTLDEDDTITSYNKTAQKITELAWREVYLKNISAIFPEISKQLHQAQNQSPRRHNYRFEMYYTKRSGQTISLGFNLTNLSNDSGETIGKIVTFQDITQFKAMEEEVRRSEKLAAIGKLAAGLAHEIRNPLASVSGSIQMLKAELTLEPVHEHLMEIILRETDRLNDLLSDFLTYARPSQIRIQSFNLKILLEEMLAIFCHDGKIRNHIEIITRLPYDLNIQGDPDQIGQAIWNLLHNAIDAMPHGGRLTVTAETDEANPNAPLGRLAKIVIEDNGLGIDPTDLPKIFDPFFTTKENGTGLGLAIDYRIIKSHQGYIDVSSQPGSGSSFTIFLPINGPTSLDE